MTQIVNIKNDLGIIPFELNMLIPDNQDFTVMALQCGGNISAENHVKNMSAIEAEAKHNKFLSLVAEQNAQLACTPEYSTPWSVIKNIARGDIRPAEGNMWILGCESIEPHELLELQASCNEVHWKCDIPNRMNEQLFLGAVVYVFNIIEPEEKLCILVQFKTDDMGGTDFEKDLLIKGNTRYVIENESHGDYSSIRLTTLICADTLSFQLNDLQPERVPYFIYHPQMNKDPLNAEFKQYRSQIYSNGERHTTTEVMCLNWASQSSIEGFGCIGGGSAFYMKVDQEGKPNYDDERVLSNHNGGLYYSLSKNARFSSYRFANQEMILKFRTSKVSQSNAALVQKSRAGPVHIGNYKWSNDSWEFMDSEIEDLVSQDYSGLEDSLQREKIISLSSGQVNRPKMPKEFPKCLQQNSYSYFWHKVYNLDSFVIYEDEKPRGSMVKLAEEQARHIHAKLVSYNFICRMVGVDRAKLPSILSDFQNSDNVIALVDDSGGIRHNAYSESSTNYVTLVHAGNVLVSNAREIFSELKNTLNPNRLIVWYNDGNGDEFISDEARNIDDDIGDFDSIDRV